MGSPTRTDVDDLELVVAFLNTVDLEEGSDELAAVGAATRWFTERGLLAHGETVGQDGLDLARDLRSALRGLASVHHDSPDTAAAAAFEQAAAAVPLRPVADATGGVRVQPAGHGIQAALGRIVAAVAHASAVGTWPRVKLCSSDGCRWAFVDASRNHSRRWCAMGICGNREKARTYRQRQRHPT